MFTDVNLSVLPGERVALVGRNGCGKSTLLRLLIGDLPLQTGRVFRPERLGFVRQEAPRRDCLVVSEYVQSQADHDPRFEALAHRLTHRLGFADRLWDQSLSTLSWGERARLEMALLLAGEPEALLLDEPTNHLDLAAREWLAGYLAQTRLPVLMACHDRAFLDQCATGIVEIENGQMRAWTGGYSDMVKMKADLLARGLDQFERESAEIRRLKNVAEKALQATEAMTKRPTGRTYDPKHKAFYRGKQNAMARRAQAVRSRAEAAADRHAEKPFIADRPAVEFPTRPLRSAVALQVSRLRGEVEGRTLFEGFSLVLEPGERVAIVGPNGCGKTTLFRILLGEIPARGDVTWGQGTQTGYVSQDRALADVDPSLTAIEAFSADKAELGRTLLARLAMSRDTHETPIGLLSPGERTKIEVARLIAGKANVLLLDEPTNHLDIDSLIALEEALREFPGCVLFTSHDQRFIEEVADHVIELAG